ncbi:MAG TPA: hypothetical protein VMW81_06405, partial [Nitrospinota bacterium]|nr:hypothetical protein [Nitrospinota bacterium]
MNANEVEVEVVYFYPLLIPSLPEKGPNLRKKDSEEKHIEHMIYFKYPYLEYNDQTIEELKENSVTFALSEPIILKNGECLKEFQANLSGDGAKWHFIGLNNHSGNFWVNLPIKIEYQEKEYDKLFGKLVALTLIGDRKKGKIISQNGEKIKIPELVDAYRHNNIVKELNKDLSPIIKKIHDVLEKIPCNPYIIVILRHPFEEDGIEGMIKKMKDFISDQNLNIASLLIRSRGVSFADETFISKYMVSKEEKLINMCARSDFFINVHERASIVIHPLLKNDNKIEPSGLKALKDTYKKYSLEFIKSVAYLIGQWYSYAVSDVWLTKKIFDYSENIQKYGEERKYNQEGKQNKKKENEAIKELKNLASIKGFVISLLQEVITLKIYRGTLRGVINTLSDYFNISQIKDNLKFKVSQ